MKNQSRWRALVYVYVSMIAFAVIFRAFRQSLALSSPQWN